MPKTYTKTLEVRWADIDPNGHLRHSAYADYATHLRFSFLAEHGFAPTRFAELEFGPVILRESTTFLQEVAPGQTVTIDFRMAGLAADGSRFHICHDFRRADGKLAATVELEGSWMSLRTRRLVAPPGEILELLQQLPRTDDFEQLSSLGRLPIGTAEHDPIGV